MNTIKTIDELPDHAKDLFEQMVKLFSGMERKELEEIFLYNYNVSKTRFEHGHGGCCGAC